MTDLVPGRRMRAPALTNDSSDFFSLQREMNRLFDEAFRGFRLAPFGAGDGGLGWPSVEVSETEKQVTVTAELAGLEEKDIELRVEDDVLTIRGEKRTASEDKDRRYSERYYGSFERRLALPAEVDEDRAKATFKNGVLTVTLPKTERARAATKRIPIASAP